MIYKLVLFFLILFSACLKTEKSPFDSNSQSGSAASYVFLSGQNAAVQAVSSSSAAPSAVSYGSSGTFTLIPGNSVNYTPTVTGKVDSWTISPALPIGLMFDSATGSITGTPSASYFTGGFPLTSFTVTAANSAGKIDFKLEIQILGSGENVWTVLHGVTGYDTSAGYGSLFFNSISNSLYAAGQTMGSLDGEVNPNPGSLSGFVTKYDLDGNRKWTRLNAVSSGNFGQNGLSVDSSENIFIAGTVYGPGVFDGISAPNNYSAAISKYDSAGNRLWSSLRYLNSSESFANGIYADSSGTVYLLGNAKGNLDSVSNPAGSDAAVSIMKYSSAGTWLSTNLIGTSSPSTGRHLTVTSAVTDSSGNLWSAGYSQAGDKCANPDLKVTPAIFKFNSSTAYQTCYSLITSAGGTAGDSVVWGIVKDSSDNMFITGYTNRNLDGLTKVSSAGDGFYDAFIAKFNSSGTLQWKRQLAVSGNTITKAWAITKSADNFYYITGQTNANLGGQTLTGTTDLFVAKYDAGGNLIWVKLLGGAGSVTVGTGIAFDTNNTMYVSGHSNGDIGGVVNPVKLNNAHLLVRFVK